MSAWPEAVYIIKQIQNTFNLNTRVLKLENKLCVFAAIDREAAQLQPDLDDEYNFTNGSIWFVEDDLNANNIIAISNYSEVSGWSTLSYFRTEADQVPFQPTSELLENITNVEDAINEIANQIENIQINNATRTTSGVVQIGNNINVTAEGVISVPTATQEAAGVTKIYNTTGNNIDGTMTQAAISAAVAAESSAQKAESFSIPVSEWSSSTVTLTGANGNYYTYNKTGLTYSYSCPAISLIASGSNQVPTKGQITDFNNINYAIVNGNTCTFYSQTVPTNALTVYIQD